MADQNNPHFKPIFYYIVFTTIFAFGYITAVTFLTVPKENQRTVDTVTGFLLGSVVMAGVGYLLGGNPASASKNPLFPSDSSTAITATVATTSVVPDYTKYTLEQLKEEALKKNIPLTDDVTEEQIIELLAQVGKT